MPYLFAVSLFWAFSFGLIKGKLAGLDSAFISAARLGLALLVFLPFLRTKQLSWRNSAALLAIGAVQFGLMYLAYNESFKHLAAYEVALLTLTTPILVTLLADALDRSFHLRSLLAALLAIAGTAVVSWSGSALHPTLTGLVLVQLSNLCFAIGQVAYKRLRARQPALRDRDVFALPYAGGFLVAFAVLGTHGFSVSVSSTQILTLVYLGVLASGVGFFLWNVGATRVNAGTLAVMNNAKAPLAVACSLLFFGESAHLPRLLVSLLLLGVAVWLADRKP